MRTFTFHASREALLEAAELATIPVEFGYRTILGTPTNIGNLFADGAFEES